MKKVFVVSHDNLWHLSIDNYYVVPVKNKNTGYCLNTYHDKFDKEITLAFFNDKDVLTNTLNVLDNNNDVNFTNSLSEKDFVDFVNGIYLNSVGEDIKTDDNKIQKVSKQ